MSVNTTQLLIFSGQFAAMIKSKLQLVEVLDNLALETPQKNLKRIVESISRQVKDGADLGDALEAHPEAFSEIYVSTVRAGLASGKLGGALEQITVYLRVLHEISRRIKSALTYPMFMLVAFFLVFNGMIFFILPRFSRMFESFGKDLPYATQVLLDIGNFWENYWHVSTGGLGMLIALFVIWTKTPDGRAIWDHYKLQLPVVGAIWRMGALARFLRTLAVQVRNEVMLLTALRLAAEASQNVYIRENLYQITQEIENGAGLAESFRSHQVFHGIVLQMIAAGEEAGVLDDLLVSSADYFENLLNDRLQMVTGLINPLLTMFVGLAVAGMMVASFLPVFQMGSMMN